MMNKKCFYILSGKGQLKRSSSRGCVLYCMNGYGERPFSLTRFCPLSKNSFISVDQRGNLFLYDLKTREYRIIFRFGFEPDKFVFFSRPFHPFGTNKTNLGLSHDYDFLISSKRTGRLLLCNLRSGKTQSEFKHSSYEEISCRYIKSVDPKSSLLRSISFHPTNSSIILATTRKNVLFWTIPSPSSSSSSQSSQILSNYYEKDKKFVSFEERLRGGVHYSSAKYATHLFLSILHQEVLVFKERIVRKSKSTSTLKYDFVKKIEFPFGKFNVEVGRVKDKREEEMYQRDESLEHFDVFFNYFVGVSSHSRLFLIDLETDDLIFDTRIPNFLHVKKIKFYYNKFKKKHSSLQPLYFQNFVVLVDSRNEKEEKINQSFLLFFHIFRNKNFEIYYYYPSSLSQGRRKKKKKGAISQVIFDFCFCPKFDYFGFSSGLKFEVFEFLSFFNFKCRKLGTSSSDLNDLNSFSRLVGTKEKEEETTKFEVRQDFFELLSHFGRFPSKYRPQIYHSLLGVSSDDQFTKPKEGEEKYYFPSLEEYFLEPNEKGMEIIVRKIKRILEKMNRNKNSPIPTTETSSQYSFLQDESFLRLMLSIYKSLPQMIPITEDRGISSVQHFPFLDIIYPFYRLFGKYKLFESYQVIIKFLEVYKPYFFFHSSSNSKSTDMLLDRHNESIILKDYNPLIMEDLEKLFKKEDEELYLFLFRLKPSPKLRYAKNYFSSPDDVVQDSKIWLGVQYQEMIRKLIYNKFIWSNFTVQFDIKNWFVLMDHIILKNFLFEEIVVSYLIFFRKRILGNVKDIHHFVSFLENQALFYATSFENGRERLGEGSILSFIGLIEKIARKNDVSSQNRRKIIKQFQ